jgi:hypothetical protein
MQKLAPWKSISTTTRHQRHGLRIRYTDETRQHDHLSNSCNDCWRGYCAVRLLLLQAPSGLGRSAKNLGLECEPSCRDRCAKMASSECALLQFSQANAVRCVGPNEPNNRSRSQERVAKCLPFLFGEIGILQPNVIVLQGRNEGTGHLQQSFRNELERGVWGRFEDEEVSRVQTIKWLKYDGWAGPSWLASLYHPSAQGRFKFDAIWDSHFRPAVDRIKKLIACP